MMKIYLAAPLFTLAERMFNAELAAELARLCPELDVFLPQRCDEQFQHLPDPTRRIYDCLMDALEWCDAVVAVLDGSDADSGTCIEMGYACGRGKRIIGVRTDFRSGEDDGLNLMVSNICAVLLREPSTTVALPVLAQRIVAVLNNGACGAAEPVGRRDGDTAGAESRMRISGGENGEITQSR